MSFCAMRLGWEPGPGSLVHTRASLSAQPSANGPTYASRPISRFLDYATRLHHCCYAELTRRQACMLWELEQKADRNSSGSNFPLPCNFLHYYHYHHLALLVLCAHPPSPNPLAHCRPTCCSSVSYSAARCACTTTSSTSWEECAVSTSWGVLMRGSEGGGLITVAPECWNLLA